MGFNSGFKGLKIIRFMRQCGKKYSTARQYDKAHALLHVEYLKLQTHTQNMR